MSVVWVKAVDATWPEMRTQHRERNRRALAQVFADQRRVALIRFRAGRFQLLDPDFDTQIAQVVYERNRETAEEFGHRVHDELVGKQFDPDLLDPWLEENARMAGENIAEAVGGMVNDALPDGSDGLDGVFTALVTVSAVMYAQSMVTTAANFGAHDGARAGGAGRKTWKVTSGNPRSAHAAMSGETVPLAETFSNGMRFPGDPSGGAEQVANCQCGLEFS